MSPPNDESRGKAAPGEAFDSTDPQTQRAAKPNATWNNSAEPASTQGKKNCTACGARFVPRRGHYRKCRDCAARFKQELIELSRKRNNDGCIVFKLLEHLHALRSDDEAARAWLESLIAGKGGA